MKVLKNKFSFIFFICVGLILCFCAVGSLIAQGVNCWSWFCDGNVSCSTEQSDYCRTQWGSMGTYCSGYCAKSTYAGNVDICTFHVMEVDGGCTYGGGAACSGTVYKRECAKKSTGYCVSEDGAAPSAGLTYCTGDWEVASGTINNCSSL